MADDDFTLSPTWVDVLEPEYANVITETDTMKKDYQNLSTTPLEQFVLRFEGLSDANAEVLYEHYKGRYGGYDAFAWLNANIPAYIIDILDLGSSNLSGRWVPGSLKLTPKARSWNAEITFEKQIE